MEKGDLLTLAGGLLLVLVIAVVVNPHQITGKPGPAVTPVPQTIQTPLPLASPAVPGVTETMITTPVTTVPTVRPDDPPYRILYTSNPFSFPRYKMPENMGIYGASDIPLRNQELVPFAFVEDTRGGITEAFSVPYPIWIINTTVIANRTPQYGNFKMAMCYANNGSVIEGEEILNRGTTYRIVQTSNTPLYMIISTAYIDSYRITLETPRNYYSSYRP